MGADTLDVLCSQAHYWRHMQPIWNAMPPHLRGRVHIPTSRGLDRILTAQGVPWVADRAAPSDNPILLAGGNDLTYARGRPIILMEHGSGQRYESWDDVAYAGGPGRDNVTLFLHPRKQTAVLDQNRYPSATTRVVGCPKLDGYVAQVRPKSKLPTIAFTWHWECNQGPPEARSAWEHYGRDSIAKVAEWWGTGSVIGHSHPRSWFQRDDYRTVGAHIAPDFDEVIARSDILIADNTSALFEFAACDRPVVLLNAPWYRRDVEHGLRFWEAADIGPQVDHPDQLLDAIAAAWTDPNIETARRERITQVYANLDGTATLTAVETILSMFFD